MLRVQRIPVRGDSMWPTLRSGDLAHWEPLLSEPRTGQVLLVRTRGQLVAHRVVSTSPLLLRGDNCPAADPQLAPGAILGRVTAVERAGRLTAHWDSGPTVLGRIRRAIKSLVGRALHASHG